MKFKNKNIYSIILNYNSADESIALFKNLGEQQNDYLTILVIDNHSNEKDQKNLLNNIPIKNLIFNEKNLGYAGGNNVGIEIALKNGADYVWILNPDIRVESQTLNTLFRTVIEDKTLAAIGPRITHRNNPDKIFSDGGMIAMNENYSAYHKHHNAELTSGSKTIDYDISFIDGSCILLNCEAIKEIGKLPEEYFLYFEETDWCFKARKHKWKLAIDSNAAVSNLTSVKRATFYYHITRNKIIFCKKYHPNFTQVRIYFIKELLKEALFRFKGNYFKPFYLSRAKGLVAGIIKTSF